MAAETSDRGIGLGIALSALSVGGALVMYLSAGEPLSGWGFALATLAGALAVAAAGAD